MIAFPNCKINLGLHITRKRADGYHDIETVFYPVALKDGLEIITSDEVTLQMSGCGIGGTTNDNLCMKAYHLLKKDFPHLPAVNIYLHKAIPAGAGLGGGSADGAFMLLLLNNKYNLQLAEDQLTAYALQLGSDCPFFIINRPVFATGRGEKMTPAELNLSAYKFMIINPGIHISTKQAFEKLAPALPVKCIRDIIQQPVETWKNDLINDFEKPLFETFPEIKKIKDDCYRSGAVYAAMTGSGSTVFGIFKKDSKVRISFPDNYLQLHLPA